jgi:hypothetical protein
MQMLENENDLKVLDQPHFTVKEVSERTRLSEDIILRWARRQPGVLIYEDPKPGKRRYRTYRIPAPVVLRLYTDFSLLASTSPVIFTRKTNKKRREVQRES